MTEYKFALEAGLTVEFKTDVNGDHYAIWNEGKSVEYITVEEFVAYTGKVEKTEVATELSEAEKSKNISVSANCEIVSLGKREIDLGNGFIVREFFLNEYGNEVKECEHYTVDFTGRTTEFLDQLASASNMEWVCRNKKVEDMYLNRIVREVKKSIFLNKENYLLIFDHNVELSVQIKTNKKGSYWLIHE